MIARTCGGCLSGEKRAADAARVDRVRALDYLLQG